MYPLGNVTNSAADTSMFLFNYVYMLCVDSQHTLDLDLNGLDSIAKLKARSDIPISISRTETSVSIQKRNYPTSRL